LWIEHETKTRKQRLLNAMKFFNRKSAFTGGILGALLPMPVLLVVSYVVRVNMGIAGYGYFIVPFAMIELLVFFLLLWKWNMTVALAYVFVNLPWSIYCVYCFLDFLQTCRLPD